MSCECCDRTYTDCDCSTQVGYYKFESFDKDRDDLVKKLDELLKELKRWNTKE